MNPELTAESRSTDRGYQQRFSEFIASRRGKMFGIAEVVALAGSCFVLALVLLSYLYFLVPARSRVATANTDLNQLQANLLESFFGPYFRRPFTARSNTNEDAFFQTLNFLAEP